MRTPQLFLQKGKKKESGRLVHFFRPGILPGLPGNVHFLLLKPRKLRQGDKIPSSRPGGRTAGALSAGGTGTDVPGMAAPPGSTEPAQRSPHRAAWVRGGDCLQLVSGFEGFSPEASY